MQTSLAHFPDLETLTAGLTSALAGAAGGRLTVVDRQPNPHASTFPSEVVTCRLGDGEPPPAVLQVRRRPRQPRPRPPGRRGLRGRGLPRACWRRRGCRRPGSTAPHADGPDRGGRGWSSATWSGGVRLRDTKEPAAWDAGRRAGAGASTPPTRRRPGPGVVLPQRLRRGLLRRLGAADGGVRRRRCTRTSPGWPPSAGASRRPWPRCWRPRGPSSTASTTPRTSCSTTGRFTPWTGSRPPSGRGRSTWPP